jgi:predicted alpha/beta-fold hydrolase
MYLNLFYKSSPLKTHNEQFDLPDGDFIDLVWTEEKSSEPLIVLLHGLEGSIDSPYVNGILKTINECGWQGVLMQFRGCSGRHNRLDRSYHSGDTGDINTLVTELKLRYPDRDLAAIGVSLGGNVLIKYLGEQGNNSPFKAAMAISIPFDLSNCASELKIGFSRIYQRYLINSLSDKVRNKFKDRTAPIDLNKLNDWTDFFLFDDNVTAPLNGFKNVDDYYTKSSCKQFIKHIVTPTLILHSKDDPFMNETALPIENDLSPSVTLELTEHGGHVGFIYGSSPFNVKYWAERRLVEFFNSYLN